MVVFSHGFSPVVFGGFSLGGEGCAVPCESPLPPWEALQEVVQASPVANADTFRHHSVGPNGFGMDGAGGGLKGPGSPRNAGWCLRQFIRLFCKEKLFEVCFFLATYRYVCYFFLYIFSFFFQVFFFGMAFFGGYLYVMLFCTKLFSQPLVN